MSEILKETEPHKYVGTYPPRIRHTSGPLLTSLRPPRPGACVPPCSVFNVDDVSVSA